MIEVLSLGAGVQSSTLYLMAVAGELPRLTEAIFSDTQREPQSVYQWLEYLKTYGERVPLTVVTRGDLGADSLIVNKSKKSGKFYQKNLIPFFLKNPDGTDGFFKRKCTDEYKIREVVKRQRELVTAPVLRAWRKKHRAALNEIEAARKDKRPLPWDAFRECQSDALTHCWIGISTDEAHRVKPSRQPWVKNTFPLLEKGMNRGDCLAWLERNGHPVAPKSSCSFCPYHSDAEWLRLLREEPQEFMAAVAFEKAVQFAAQKDEVTKGTLWLHRERIPLEKVKFDEADVFSGTCDGYCKT